MYSTLHTTGRRLLLCLSTAAAAAVLACSPAPDHGTARAAAGVDPCDNDNTGLTLPSEFCATVFADNLGHARHLVVAQNGDVYVNTWSDPHNENTNAPGGFIVALRDKDRDGRAETVERFGPAYETGKPGGGTGIAIHNGALYVESRGAIVRYALVGDNLVPAGAPETIVDGLPVDGDHAMHPFAIAADGTLYVNSGSATNSCQQKNRTLESPGKQPCDELTIRAGIWRYTTTKTGQAHTPASRFVTGTRNVVALAVHPSENVLYAVLQGRDQLSDNWPKLYTARENNEQPAELFIRAEAGQDYGWPTCYFDGSQKKHVLAPEYGGDGGKKVGPCQNKAMPLSRFPAHWAPEALTFASQSLPERYRDGAFVSFHGSWNRTPTQSGFLVAFVPIKDQKAGDYEEFAKGFSGKGDIANPKAAPNRPMGLAFAPDGTLYVSDDVKGRIWRIALKRK